MVAPGKAMTREDIASAVREAIHVLESVADDLEAKGACTHHHFAEALAGLGEAHAHALRMNSFAGCAFPREDA